MLQADPHTDWSRVDIDALRQHLIDMDELTMRATYKKEPIENGLRIKVTGSDRTLEAIQRMVPEHVRDIDGMYGWAVRATAFPNGVELTVTAGNSADVQKINALGSWVLWCWAAIRCIILPWPRASPCIFTDSRYSRRAAKPV